SAVVGKRVVARVVRRWAVQTAAAVHTFHVCAPTDARIRELRPKVVRGQRMVTVVANTPGLTGCEREIVGDARVRDRAVVVRDPVLGGKRCRELAPHRLAVRAGAMCGPDKAW